MFMMALQVATLFNLICTSTGQSENRDISPPRTLRTMYRINLELNYYCANPCEGPRRIHAVDSDVITLRHDDASPAPEELLYHIYFNRVTGAYRESTFQRSFRHPGVIIRERNGHCEVAPYTRIPGLVF
jgi:hypothetical protein